MKQSATFKVKNILIILAFAGGVLFSGLLYPGYAESAEGSGIKWGQKFFPLGKTGRPASKQRETDNKKSSPGSIAPDNRNQAKFYALARSKINRSSGVTRTIAQTTAKNSGSITPFNRGAGKMEIASLPSLRPESRMLKDYLKLRPLPSVEIERSHDDEVEEEVSEEIGKSVESQARMKSYLVGIIHAWPFKKGEGIRITSGYGWRTHPVTHKKAFHKGIDIAAVSGAPILATATGIVEEVGVHKNLGKYVKILHNDGSYSIYGHMKKWVVAEGERIREGAKIGEVGLSGRTTGPHLHYSIVVDGKAVDPMKFLKKNLPFPEIAMMM